MNKNAIKSFAVWARTELIEKVTQKAFEYGIEKDCIVDEINHSINGRILSNEESNQRKQLIHKVQENGFDQVMEEVAYTWFNRFIALRFMEVNNYLPSKVRIFTNENNEFQPQVLQEALDLDFHGLDSDKIYELMESNNKEELFKYILVAQCNELGNILPGMFTQISDYKVLLLPNNLLREGSVLCRLVSDIDEEDWQDQVQIIGWLYQYYNSEFKDEVFAKLKKNVKINKDTIPAATQLFTPDWIVRYMVENSLGRLWLEGHPNKELQDSWKYYLEEAEQEEDVQKQLEVSREKYRKLNPEDIKVLDPCMGSGHILVYAFDVLMQIYTEFGYTKRDAVQSILENNLYGLDIDERASQLSYFAIMMKARNYDRRIFNRGIQPKVYEIVESNNVDTSCFEILGEQREIAERLITELYDAKEYGSILTPNITLEELDELDKRLDEMDAMADYGNLVVQAETEIVISELEPLITTARTLVTKYDVVVTNPPYMGGSGMSAKLSSFVKKNYPDSKSDLFAVFIEQCNQFLKKNGYQAMITQHAWMFLSSYEKLRDKILKKDIVNMAHLGPRAFDDIGGEVVQTTSFILSSKFIKKYRGIYCRLIEPTTQKGKEDLFLEKLNEYSINQENFFNIPGNPIAYWTSKKVLKSFNNCKLSNKSEIKAGLQTGDNEKFLRVWTEVNYKKIIFNYFEKSDNAMYKWFPYNKGGSYRKWFGNNEYIINWENNGYEVKLCKSSVIRNSQFYFKENITWSTISSNNLSMRYSSKGFLFDTKGSCCFFDSKIDLNYFLGFLNSKVVSLFMGLLAPTLDYSVGSISKLPIRLNNNYRDNIVDLTDKCIQLSKRDWDSFETSWDFEVNPLVRWSTSLWDSTAIGMTMQHYYGCHPEVSSPIELCYMLWKGECESRFKELQSNEEQLNRIFIDIYGLQDELTPEVADKDVTVYRIFDSKEDIPSSMGSSKYSLTKCDVIKSFISYAVGCMLGRYSLDYTGLAYAGGEWDESKYKSFIPDKDNIIPICDDEYFEDDIVGRFIKFVEVVYGADSLEANLEFIASALGGKGTSREVIRKYFLNDFYKDHCKTYQKRPIYWLFDSGKKNGFKALVYLHRYQSDTIARLRTGYVHEMQARYYQQIQIIEDQLNGELTTSEKVKLNKELKKFKEQSEELKGYEEKVHHYADQMIELDLDDGVKVNYAKFADILAKIK